MSKSLNFTKAALESLPPPIEGRADYRDTKVTTLMIRVSATGRKVFSVYAWNSSQQKPMRYNIGKFPDWSIEQARKKALEIINAWNAGEDPGQLKQQAREELTLGEFFARYIEQHAKAHKRSWKQDVGRFDKYLTNASDGLNLAAKKISSITKSDIATLHLKIGKTQPTTANRVLALLSVVFNLAKDWGILSKDNPTNGVKKFAENHRDRFVQRDEMPRFFAALQQENSPAMRDFFLLCLFTGARSSNVMAMRWEHISVDRREWRIPADESKNGQALHVILSDEALAVLAERGEGNATPWVFPSRSASGHLTEPKKAWQQIFDRDELAQIELRLRASGYAPVSNPSAPLHLQLIASREQAAAAGIDVSGCRMPPTHIHDLRRTHGSFQAIGGSSLPIIAKSLGHRTLASTQIYAHLDRDPIRESVEDATRLMMRYATQNQSQDEDLGNV